MPEDRIAERLLECVTMRERAASTVGDLRESAAAHGEWWFWSNVLRTTGSLAWTGMVGQKRRMAGFALAGVALTFLLEIVLVLIVGVLPAIGSALWHAYRTGMGAVGIGWSPGGLSLVVTAILAQFLVGRWIGPRGGFSACLAVTILLFALDVIYGITCLPQPAYALTALLSHSCFFLGALSVRRRNLI